MNSSSMLPVISTTRIIPVSGARTVAVSNAAMPLTANRVGSVISPGATASTAAENSSPSIAPKALIKRYGTQNGFGWQPKEIVAAQIISIPMSVPIKLANEGLRNLLITLGTIFFAAIALIDLGMYFIVIRPLRKVSQAADRISTGEIDLPPLPVKGKDEIAEVTTSFNRMHTSLKKAMELLNG